MCFFRVYRQLILVMKALAEQQAENESLREENLQSRANGEEDAQLRVQQLEQQLQQIYREQEVTKRLCLEF